MVNVNYIRQLTNDYSLYTLEFGVKSNYQSIGKNNWNKLAL